MVSKSLKETFVWNISCRIYISTKQTFKTVAVARTRNLIKEEDASYYYVYCVLIEMEEVAAVYAAEGKNILSVCAF